MEIKKDDRMAAYRRVAIGTGASLIVVLGVTLLGISVFSPQDNHNIALKATPPNVSGVRDLIGSHEVRAADEDKNVQDHIDALADTLDKVVGETLVDNTTGEITEARTTNESAKDGASVTISEKDLKTAAEAGVAAVSLWQTLWQFIWPKVQAVSGAVWGIFSS